VYIDQFLIRRPVWSIPENLTPAEVLGRRPVGDLKPEGRMKTGDLHEKISPPWKVVPDRYVRRGKWADKISDGSRSARVIFRGGRNPDRR
jgi:hypothetical protein